MSDGVLTAYSPLLEVLPRTPGPRGSALRFSQLLAQNEGLYMIDVTCDDVPPFYELLDFRKAGGAIVRTYERASHGDRQRT